MRHGLALVMVGGLVGGCVASPELSETEQLELSETEQLSETDPHGICNPLICGFNSPQIDNIGFHELDMTGTESNAQGYKIEGFWKGTVPYSLEVRNAKLTGIDHGGARLEREHLVGAQIHVSHGRSSFVIRVAGVGSMMFPVGPDDPVETYTLESISMVGDEPVGAWKNLCGLPPIPPSGDSEYAGFETFGQEPTASILFEGDRIAGATMTMSKQPDPSWFNVGCSGHMLSKLFLTRNTIASQPRWEHRHPERQATLKLLTADYCGTGRAFTVAGQKLVWQGGDMVYQTTPENLEARWNEDGAICIGNPRMRTPTTAEGALQFPDIDEAIKSECRIQYCDDLKWGNFDGALRVSGNY